MGLLPSVFDFDYGYDTPALLYLAKNIDYIMQTTHTEVFERLLEAGPNRDSLFFMSLAKKDQSNESYAGKGGQLGKKDRPFSYAEGAYIDWSDREYGVMHENNVHARRREDFVEEMPHTELIQLEDSFDYWSFVAKEHWGFDLKTALSSIYISANHPEPTDSQKTRGLNATKRIKKYTETQEDFATFLFTFLKSELARDLFGEKYDF